MLRGVAVALSISALALSAGLNAACGTEPRLSKDWYSRRVTAAFAAVEARLRPRPRIQRLEGASGRLRAFKRALDRAAATLDRLDPPGDAEEEHLALVSATRDYAHQVDLVRASVDFGDPVLIATHLREVTAPARIGRAIRSLNAKGYRIPVHVALLR